MIKKKKAEILKHYLATRIEGDTQFFKNVDKYFILLAFAGSKWKNNPKYKDNNNKYKKKK